MKQFSKIFCSRNLRKIVFRNKNENFVMKKISKKNYKKSAKTIFRKRKSISKKLSKKNEKNASKQIMKKFFRIKQSQKNFKKIFRKISETTKS